MFYSTCIIGQDTFAFSEGSSFESKIQSGKTRKTFDFLKKGSVRFENQQYHQALDLATDARKYCDVFKSLNLLGVINAGLGYHGTGERLLEKALEYGESENLNLDTIHFNLAGIQLQNGEYDRALSSLNTIGSPEAFIHFSYYKGGADYELGNIESAMNELKDAIDNDPKNADAYYYIGLAQYGAGNYNEAANNLSNAVRLENGNISYLISAANANEKIDANKASLSYFYKAHQKEPKNVNALLGIGNLNCKLSHYQKANHYFNKVLEINKKSFAAYYGLANVQ